MRFRCFLLLTGLGLILGPAARHAPLRVTAVEAGERAAPAKPATDLEGRWKQLAGGAAVWRRADVTDPQQQFVFDLVAERVHSANGEITREQFLAISRPAAGRRADDSARAPDAVAERPKPVEPPKPAERPKSNEHRNVTLVSALSAGKGGGNNDPGPVAGAEAEFRRRDRNGDGLLDYDEMDDALRAERERWDVNNDGFIDPAEFRAYFKARTRQERSAGGGAALVLGSRAGKLPKAAAAADLPPGLPDWFRKYDTDGDGQITLYEWRCAGQPTARFRAMDNNDDGFLTPDEVLATLPNNGQPQVAKETKEPPRNDNPEPPANAAKDSYRRALMMEQIQFQLEGARLHMGGGNGGIIIRTGK
ncbi:MAG TPA: hypothetical protein VFW33_15080 [Gemmataceae bacterium]|nr:hypothetical protein [Gemmataceae bacterium]